MQVTIHTDTLNESCCVEGSVAAFKGRTIHAYHSEVSLHQYIMQQLALNNVCIRTKYALVVRAVQTSCCVLIQQCASSGWRFASPQLQICFVVSEQHSKR
jgi:hypothetical protein